ncbi:MAG: cbb3-type cytochrome c oxidase subunit I [Chlorobi bacterium]|nr:cbb3-type cytochrome c oxidase subunit I [Chlorobiota bacterium]
MSRLFATESGAVAKRYLLFSFAFLFIGGWLALLMRWQLGYPGHAVPATLGGGLLPQEMAPDGVILPDTYNGLMTMHATFMVYFAVLPVLVGFFGNLLVPLQIGAERAAYPRLNALAFWLMIPAGAMMIAGFFVEGGPASSGWTAYPPLSVFTGFSGSGLGMNLWIVALIVVGLSLILGAINLAATVILHRRPGMEFFQMPLATWALFTTALLVLVAIPVLAVSLGMLLSDRVAGTTFFIPEGLHLSGKPMNNPGGGQPLLWQHLFWFFGHPVVYILVLPAMGIVSDLLARFSGKPVFNYRGMVYSTWALAGLGCLVWGHHMFQSGMNPMLGTTFMVATMVIAVPSGLKTLNWLGTLWGGSIRFTVPMMCALAFVSLFVVGGLSGIFMASSSVDTYIHDTYFIVAHFHYVLIGGTLFATFGGITYWFPKLYGRLMNPTLGYAHFWLTFIFFNLTFFPMHILGIAGHPRRIFDPTAYDFLRGLQPINVFITWSAVMLGLTQLLFVANWMWSRKKGRIGSEFGEESLVISH